MATFHTPDQLITESQFTFMFSPLQFFPRSVDVTDHPTLIRHVWLLVVCTHLTLDGEEQNLEIAFLNKPIQSQSHLYHQNMTVQKMLTNSISQNNIHCLLRTASVLGISMFDLPIVWIMYSVNSSLSLCFVWWYQPCLCTYIVVTYYPLILIMWNPFSLFKQYSTCSIK